MVVHHVVVGRRLVVVARPGVITVTVYDTRLDRAVILIFIGCTQGEVVANGVTERHTELPRSIDLEVIRIANMSFIIETIVLCFPVYSNCRRYAIADGGIVSCCRHTMSVS